MVQRPQKLSIVIGLMCFVLAACMTVQNGMKKKADRGIRSDHAHHATEELACDICHSFDEGGLVFPNHDVCGFCHEVEEPDPDTKGCALCHTNEDIEITPWEKVLSEEIKFDHPSHLAKEIECATCHEDADKAALLQDDLMAFCNDCHIKTDAALGNCEVCHNEITKDTRPQYRGDQRIQHDAPAVWSKVHGFESKMDPEFCSMCHGETEAFCEDCHRTNEPQSHTISWRRKTHGLNARWDRQACATCHEEDMCMKCHESNEPSSHRAGWDSPSNYHCVTCHYPPRETGCGVCHEQIDHPSAMPSPHNAGEFPSNCSECHEGGLPTRPPHPRNSTAPCLVCH